MSDSESENMPPLDRWVEAVRNFLENTLTIIRQLPEQSEGRINIASLEKGIFDALSSKGGTKCNSALICSLKPLLAKDATGDPSYRKELRKLCSLYPNKKITLRLQKGFRGGKYTQSIAQITERMGDYFDELARKKAEIEATRSHADRFGETLEKLTEKYDKWVCPSYADVVERTNTKFRDALLSSEAAFLKEFFFKLNENVSAEGVEIFAGADGLQSTRVRVHGLEETNRYLADKHSRLRHPEVKRAIQQVVGNKEEADFLIEATIAHCNHIARDLRNGRSSSWER